MAGLRIQPAHLRQPGEGAEHLLGPDSNLLLQGRNALNEYQRIPFRVLDFMIAFVKSLGNDDTCCRQQGQKDPPKLK